MIFDLVHPLSQYATGKSNRKMTRSNCWLARFRLTQENEGTTKPFSCQGQETEGEKEVGTLIDTPKEKPRASQDAAHVLDKEHSAAGYEKEERYNPAGSSTAASQERSVREVHDDRGGGGAVREGGRSSGDGDGQDGQRQIGEPTEVPASPGRAKQRPSHNRTESHQPKAAGTATTTGSTCSATTAVIAGESGAATQVTWRGQSGALGESIVIPLRESSLRKLRCGRRRCHKSGADDTKALAGDSEHGPTSSDDDSDARLLARERGRRLYKSAQHKVAQGRDREGTRGRSSESGSSKRGSSAQRNNSPPSKTAVKDEHLADRKSSSQCQRKEALPLDLAGSSAPTPPRGSQGQGSGARSLARPAVFLLEPYAGPPVAACSRAWPAGTMVMADPMEGCRRRNRHARCKSSGSHASRRLPRELRSTGGETQKRLSTRTRVGSSGSSTSGGATSSESSSDRDNFAREDKGRDGLRAGSKEG